MPTEEDRRRWLSEAIVSLGAARAAGEVSERVGEVLDRLLALVAHDVLMSSEAPTLTERRITPPPGALKGHRARVEAELAKGRDPPKE